MKRRVLYRFRRAGEPLSAVAALALALEAAAACWGIVQRNPRGAAWTRAMTADPTGRAIVKSIIALTAVIERHRQEHEKLYDAWWWRLGRAHLVKHGAPPRPSHAASALRRTRVLLAVLYQQLDKLFVAAIAEAEAGEHACRALLDGAASPDPGAGAIVAIGGTNGADV